MHCVANLHTGMAVIMMMVVTAMEHGMMTSVRSLYSREGGDTERQICENAEQLVGQKVLEGQPMGHLVHGQREAVINNAPDGPGHQEENRPRGAPHLVGQEHLHRNVVRQVNKVK